MRNYDIGSSVIFVDARGNGHHALVTAWHGLPPSEPDHPEPCINLVFVSSDELRTDRYGRQIEREPTSVVHTRQQQARGNYWKWPDE